MNAKTRRDEAALERRRTIVDAAEKCFAEKGFHQTSMRDLAKCAGVSLGNVYNHFESKTELILEIARHEAEGLRAIQAELSKIKDPAKALDAFVLIYAKTCSDREYALLAAEIVSEGLRNPEICADFLNNRSMLVETVTGILQRIVERHDVALRIPVADCAESVIELIEGFAARFAFARKMPRKRELAILKTGAHQLIGI